MIRKWKMEKEYVSKDKRKKKKKKETREVKM